MDLPSSVDEAEGLLRTPPTDPGKVVLNDHGVVALNASRQKNMSACKKTHQRSVTAVRVTDMTRPEGLPGGIGEEEEPSPASHHAKSFTDIPEKSQIQTMPEKLLDIFGVQSDSEVPHLYKGDLEAYHTHSGSSSDSNSTIRELSHEQRNGRVGRDGVEKGLPTAKLDVMSYLDGDSPTLSEGLKGSCQKMCQHPSLSPPLSTSPLSQSSTPSQPSSTYSERFLGSPDHQTDRSTSPEQSPTYQGLRIKPPPSWNKRHRSYGTLEMPRGNTSLPHISPKVLASQVAGYASGHVKPLPRAEKLPLTGYEQLASQLSNQGSGQQGPHLRPIYRRFTTLNHRLLLHLQDELCDLEEQLRRLDTADTQTRRLQNGILPASRRAEALSGGELQWHKTDILGKIGFKLEQYNKVLASFGGTSSLPVPTMADIHEYRGYLATYTPIVGTETRFLDHSEDLICLDGWTDAESCDEDTAATPVPRRESALSSPQASDESVQDQISMTPPGSHVSQSMSPVLGTGVMFAVVVSALILNTVPGYIQRMSIVVLVAMAMTATLVQSGATVGDEMRRFSMCIGAYGVVMAVIAAVY